MAPFVKGALGQEAEDQWSDLQRRNGIVIFPAANCENNTGKRGAPSLLVGDHALPVADFLVMGPRPHWDEVKGKHRPSWFREFGRWEHGIDYAGYRQYLDGERLSGFPVAIALLEINSPQCPICDGELIPIAPSHEHQEGKRCRCSACAEVYEQPALFPVRRWLYAWLDTITKYGSPRSDWPAPGGRGSKDGKGGWLWPRSRMLRRAVEERDRKTAIPRGTQTRLL